MKTKILFSSLTFIVTLSAYAQSWSITGNNGTNSSIHFIGTKDAQPLVFRVNNVRAGFIDHNTANANLAFGYSALLLNTSGQVGSAFGTKALYNNTTGYANSAFGAEALYANKDGEYNTALGARTLYKSTASFNTAGGYAALYENTTGERNAAFGYKALAKNTIGYNNSALGNMALYSNTEGYKNTATGDSALFYNTTGYKNTASGAWALQKNTTGYFNTAHGYASLEENKTGNQNTAVGTAALYSNKASNNTSVGHISLYANTTGQNNAAFGSNTMYYNQGSNNSAFGYSAATFNIAGSNNASFGYNAMLYASGNNNTGIGANTSISPGNFSNVTVIGADAIGTADNQVRIGNSSVTSIGGYVNWTTVSDGRVKKNINNNVPGLDFINKLKPVTYNLNLSSANAISKTERKDHDKKVIPFTEEEQKAIKQKEQIVYTGFIAQEVEAVAKELKYDFSGVDAPKNDQDLYGIRYAEFVAPLVKAVQELSKEKDEQQKEMEVLKQQNNMLLERLDNIEKGMTGKLSSALQSSENTVEQNIPNAFNGNTVIRYHIPSSATNAQIIITNTSGEVVKTITLSVKGSSSVIFSSAGLAAGTYYYSLVVNGKKTDSKKMVLMK